MSMIKCQMERDEERGASFVQELIDGGYLEGAALGIAKLWLDGDDDALSVKQAAVLQKHVFGPYVTERCHRCEHKIPWSEMFAAHYNGGFCGRCAYLAEKGQ